MAITTNSADDLDFETDGHDNKAGLRTTRVGAGDDNNGNDGKRDRGKGGVSGNYGASIHKAVDGRSSHSREVSAHTTMTGVERGVGARHGRNGAAHAINTTKVAEGAAPIAMPRAVLALPPPPQQQQQQRKVRKRRASSLRKAALLLGSRERERERSRATVAAANVRNRELAVDEQRLYNQQQSQLLHPRPWTMSVQHDGRSQGYQPPELQRGGQPPSFLFSFPPEATPSRATPYPLDLVSSNLRFRSRSHSAVPSLSGPQTEQGDYFGSVGDNWSDRDPGFASVRENRSAPCSPNARKFSRHEHHFAGEDRQYQNHFGIQSKKENMSATYASGTLLSPPRNNAFKEPLTLDASSPSPIPSLSSTSTNGTIPSPAAVTRALASTGSKPDRKKTGSKATSSKAGPTSAPLPIPASAALADPTDPWDYTETERWGWFILMVTWIVFVIGIGSCFGVWSWAWDVGETPYAPPELEDDPTLPIVGYYPALIILTAVMAWVWVVVAWVGMKYFRHANIVGEEL